MKRAVTCVGVIMLISLLRVMFRSAQTLLFPDSPPPADMAFPGWVLFSVDAFGCVYNTIESLLPTLCDGRRLRSFSLSLSFSFSRSACVLTGGACVRGAIVWTIRHNRRSTDSSMHPVESIWFGLVVGKESGVKSVSLHICKIRSMLRKNANCECRTHKMMPELSLNFSNWIGWSRRVSCRCCRQNPESRRDQPCACLQPLATPYAQGHVGWTQGCAGALREGFAVFYLFHGLEVRGRLGEEGRRRKVLGKTPTPPTQYTPTQ